MFDTPYLTLANSKNKDHAVEYQAHQVRQLDTEGENKCLRKLKVFKATNRNKALQFKFGEFYHNIQMICYVDIKAEADWNQLIDMDILKQTSGNAIKPLKIEQRTCKVTRNGKTARAILEIIKKEFQPEKKKR